MTQNEVRNDMPTDAIISAGMKLLRENLGILETEIFISNVSKNEFDYTKWRENLWEDLTLQELFDKIRETEKNILRLRELGFCNILKELYK